MKLYVVIIISSFAQFIYQITNLSSAVNRSLPIFTPTDGSSLRVKFLNCNFEFPSRWASFGRNFGIRPLPSLIENASSHSHSALLSQTGLPSLSLVIYYLSYDCLVFSALFSFTIWISRLFLLFLLSWLRVITVCPLLLRAIPSYFLSQELF